MTESQRDECLIQLVKSVNKLDNRMDNIENKMDNFENKLEENIAFTKSINDKLEENIAFTRRINQSVAVMEVDHGGKLNALFDGYKANSEKLDKIETDIQKIQSIVEKHDNEIYLIKSR